MGERQHMTEELVDVGTGSTRSRLDERYELIPGGPLKRLAGRYTLGAEKHGSWDWQKGQPAGVVFSHIIKHLFLFAAGARSDDHLAAAAWGCFALMWFQENLPEMFVDFPGPEGKESPHE